MGTDDRMLDSTNDRTTDGGAPDDAESLVTELERALRDATRPSAEDEARIRARLAKLYLSDLGDPLSAAVHVEPLLERDTVEASVLEAAAALVEHKPIAARIAEKLSTAYGRLGLFADEMGMLTKELSLARSPRLEQVKRRLAILHFERLEDAEGALDMLEPLVLRASGDDGLRAEYVRIAGSAEASKRAIRTLMRASRTEKDGSARTRILTDLGELYAKEGELKRSRQAFLDALSSSPSEPRALFAATRLLSLEPDPGDPKIVGPALEAIVRFEADTAKRHSAAERLLALAGTDDDRKVLAWRALVDSNRGPEALDALTVLLEKRNDVAGLIEVLRARGGTREAQARLIPLLEKAGLWAELAETLERQAGVVPDTDAAALFARLGRIRQSRLSDGKGALAAFARSLDLDPKNAMSRSTLEKMMAEGADRLAAAELLERAYRKEGFTDGLARVLATRAAVSASPAEKLSALDDAFEAARAAGLPSQRVSPIVETALAEAARHDVAKIATWLGRFRELSAVSGDAARDADVLVDALGKRPVDCPELVALACAAIDALLAVDKVDRARAVCAAALAVSPASTALLAHYDAIAGPREDPSERLSRYQAALDRTTDATERRNIMQVIAGICRESIDDLPRAIELWQHILKDDPQNVDALMGLFSAYERLDNPEALFAELDHALEFVEGEQRQAVLLRKAAALSKFGERDESSRLREEILRQPKLRNSIVESILTAAYEDDQPEVYREALELQAKADDPATRMLALERLGDYHFERLGDRRAAIDSWKPAARLYTKESPEDEHARELYERVLEASPDDREAAWKLVELYAKAGDWVRVPEVYGALLRSEGGLDAAVERLLSLEGDATRAGAVDDYVSMVDETVPRLGAEAGDTLYRLLQAKARALSADPARQAEASAAHRQLIESFEEEKDCDAFESFIESRGSADDRQDDLRWLYEFRANHSESPAEVLFEWARSEEEYGDVEAAIRVYERCAEANPSRKDALEALARLKRASGDLEGCLKALVALRDGAEPERAVEYDLGIARLLSSELAKPMEAARAVVRHLGGRRAREALNILRLALKAPKDRSAVIEIVENAIRDSNTDTRAAGLRLIVDEAGADASIPESSRAVWYDGLVELLSGDLEAALDVAAAGVQHLPNTPALWDTLERCARRADRPDRAAAAYRRAVEQGMAPDLGDAVGRKIVELLDESSSDPEEVVRTLDSILKHVPRARWALDRIKLVLSAQGRWSDLFELYDRAIAGTDDDLGKADLLQEAAVAARDLGRDHERAISYLERLLVLRPDDAAAQAALERLYERHGLTRKVIELLAKRAEAASGLARSELSHRIAASWLDLGEVAAARDVMDAMLVRGASVDDVKDLLERSIALIADRETGTDAPHDVFERAASLLSAHYAAAGQTDDLIRLTKTALAVTTDANERARCVRDLVRLRLETAYDASDAFALTFAAVREDVGDDTILARIACEAVLDEAVKDWERTRDTPASDAARTAFEAIEVLAELHFTAGNAERAVSVLTEGAKLPFETVRKRELRSRAARALAERMNDPGRSIAAFRDLFAEDAADSVAAAVVEKFSEVLASAGLVREQAELWEKVATGLAQSGKVAEARKAWSRAASFWEGIEDAGRAIATHRAAAALGSSSALEALARLHSARAEWRAAADALEWLAGGVSGDERVRWALSMADAYVRIGERNLARARLAEAVRAAPHARAARTRLLELYREDSVWKELADLLVASADVAETPDERLSLLKEASRILLHQLNDAAGAVPLAQRVLEMDPESVELRLDLGSALDAIGEHEESVTTLRRGLELAGDKRSKHSGALHRALARALLHSGRRSEALAELETAAKLSPTDPSTLYDLSRLASEHGASELAERTLRALLLALHHPAGPAWEGPTRAEVYLDLSQILASRGDEVEARELVESAFDSALGSPEETARLERALGERGRHDLVAIAVERRLRSASSPQSAAGALSDLVALWEGPLARSESLRTLIARHADVIGRETEDTGSVARVVWEALERANGAVGGESARVDTVKKHIEALTRAAEREKRKGALEWQLEAACLRADALGDVERASNLIEGLFKKSPGDPNVWEKLRDYSMRLGRRDRLVELVESALTAVKEPAVRGRLRHELAKLLLEDPARTNEAIPVLEALVADEPSHDAAGELLCDLLERASRHEELGALLSRRLEGLDRTENAKAFVDLSLRLGRALEGSSRATDAARAYANVATEVEASRDDLRFAVARLEALGSEHLADAIERLARLEKGAEAANLARRLAELRTAKADEPGVLRALQIGFAAAPEDSFFVQKLVDAYQRRGDQDSALEVLNGALLRNGTDADLLRARAWLFEGAGRLEDALADIEKAFAVDSSLSDDLVTILARASAEERGGDGRRALALVDLLVREGRSDEARATLESLLERSPDHVGGLERLASLAAADGDWERAGAACQRLLPLLGGDPAAVARVSLVLADACERRDGLADAKIALEHALELVPGSVEIRNRLAKAYEAVGERHRLADLLESSAAKENDPAEKAQLLLQAAELHLASDGAVARAFDLVRRSRELDPQRPEALLVLAKAEAKLGRVAEAMSSLRDLLKTAKGRGPALVSRAYFELATLLLGRDEIFEAFDALNQAFNADPKNDEAGLLLGLVALDLDDEKTASRAFRTVTVTRSTLPPESKAVAFYHLARIAQSKGDLRRAKLLATNAVAENANDSKARALLEVL